jgi:NAD(P)-dependent dehydrogenase (short-subunit alcohol dehydrogenase family)
MQSIFVPNLLAGQAAFVTGGGSGIGTGIAKMLARQGARVALLGRRKEKIDEVAAEIGVSRLMRGDADAIVRKRVPLARFGTVDGICEAVLFLSSRAGAYVTGISLRVDGGTSLCGPGPFLELMEG